MGIAPDKVNQVFDRFVSILAVLSEWNPNREKVRVFGLRTPYKAKSHIQ